MNEQAKLILSAFRPGGADAENPAFQEALQQAKTESALGEWFSEQQIFDRAIAEALLNVEPPPELRAKILAGGKVSRPKSSWMQRWRLDLVLAAAAAVVMFFGLASAWMAPPKLSGWQRQSLVMVEDIVAARAKFDHQNPHAGELLAWLHTHSAPAPAALPPSLADASALGCKTFTWKEHPISVVCFDVGHGQSAHVFTTMRTGLAGAPPAGKLVFIHDGSWNVLSWREGERALMLASNNMDEAQLRALLGKKSTASAPVAILP